MYGFYGNYNYGLDLKGRAQIPAQFRSLIPEDKPRIIVMTKGPDNCIHTFHPSVWREYIDRMSNLEMDKSEKLELMREVLAQTTNVNVDAQFRFKVPTELAEYAMLKEDIEFIGFNDRIEIWNPDIRKEHRSKIKKIDRDKLLDVLIN